ncbi:MAG: hypothetical protein ABR558_04040 [Thioalkalivibrio sp.]
MRPGIWFAGVVVILLGAVGYWLGGAMQFVSPESGSDPWDAGLVPPVSPCTLDAQGCAYVLPGGEVRIRGRDRIRPLEPFEITIEGALPLDGAQVRFTMEEMDMGVNQFRFEGDERGVWRTKAVLPVCTVDLAQWRATVWFGSGGERYRMEIIFEAGR